jgi:hypothetical protein
MNNPTKVRAIALAVCGLSFVSSAYAQQVFFSDFDPVASGGTGNTSISAHTGSLAINQTQAFANRISLATTPLAISGRPGSGVIRFETRQEDGNYGQTSGNRAEFKFADQSTNSSNTAPKEIWYAWSIYAPDPVDLGLGAWDGGDTDGSNSGNGGGDEIYIQIHAPDGISLGGNPENPPVALYRRVDAGYPANKGKWRFLYRWGLNNSNERVGVDIGTFEFNQWTDFVMRVVWSNNSSNPGAVQLWMNGVQVVNVTNQRVGYANMGYTYFKEGIYAYGWNNNQATDTYRAIAYYDEIKIYEGATTYANMKPRGGAATVPSAPSGLATGSATSSTLAVAWSDNSSDEQGFRIERKQGAGTYAQIADLGAGVTTFTDAGLAPNTAYTYRVYSYNVAGNSAFSNESTGTTLAGIPSAPTGLTAVAGNGAVTLDWSDTAGASAYTIRYGGSSGSYPNSVTGLTVSNGSVTGLTNDTTYYFVVTATNSSGTSANSAEVTATPIAGTGGTVTLYPVEDTYAFGGSAGTNYGTDLTFAAKEDGTASTSFDRVAYLKFDLSGVASNPTAATLTLTSNNTTEGGTATVNQLATDSWTETGLTWTNRPGIGSAIASNAITAAAVNDYSYDVLSYVQSQYTGDASKIVSFAVTGNNAQLKFASREAGVGDRPSLVLTTGSAGTLINDDFSASNSNWTNVAGGSWSVTGGKLQLTAPATPSGSQPNGNIRTHNTSLAGNFTYTVDASVTSNTGSAFDDFSIIFGYTSATSYYYASFNESNDAGTNGLFFYNGTTSTQLVDFTALIAPGTTYTVKVEYIGSTLKVYRGPVGGTLSLYATYTVTLPAGGRVGVGSKNDAATFDNVLVVM